MLYLLLPFIVPSTISMLIFPWSSFFFGDLIKFVLEKLINNLLRSHHIFTFLSSELTVFSRGKEIMTGLESSCMGSSRERQDLSGVSWNWITGELKNETEGQYNRGWSYQCVFYIHFPMLILHKEYMGI